MHENVGGTIKKLAVAVCWIGILVCFIGAIILWHLSLSVQGCILLVAGSLCSWVSSLFTYGFGELIEKVDATHQELVCQNDLLSNLVISFTANNTTASESYSAGTPIEQNLPSETGFQKPAQRAIIIDSQSIQCPVCGCTQNSNRNVCWDCGTSFIQTDDPE